MIDTLSILATTTVETAASANPITEVTDPFHVTWSLLLAQTINFLIVAFVLKKFAFAPIQKMLEQRRERIAEGEKKLKRIEQQLADSEKRTQEAIDKANADAQRLIEEAKESAASLSEKKAQEAIASAQAILAKAEEAAKAERKSMEADLKKHFGKLITETTASVTGKVLTEDDQKRINEEALASIEA